MSFLSKYKTDKIAEEAGVWVDFDEEISVKIARINNKNAVALSKKLEKPYAKMTAIPDHVREDNLIKVMSQAVVKDWKGITNSDGEVIPFTPAAAEKLLNEYQDFLNDVVSAAAAKETFQLEGIEASKND